MDNNFKDMTQPVSSKKPEIIKENEIVKAAHLSSNPINDRKSNNGTAHFEVEVQNAFFRIFFGC